MDIIHHAVMGGIGMATLGAAGHEFAGAAFLAGSVAPDLDVLLVVFGKRAYWKNHQAASHSLFVAPLLALLIVWPLSGMTANPLVLYVLALSGLLLHVLLDWVNTFGIGLFWPISPRRYALDAVFLVDWWAWGLSLFSLWRFTFFPDWLTTAAYGALLLLYIAAKILLQRRVCEELSCRAAIPSSVNPFTFYILEVGAEGASTYLYNWLRKRRWHERDYPAVPEKYLRLAQTSKVFRDMEGIVRHLFITNVEEDREGVTIIAHDLAVRNYGGRFGRIELCFDQAGKLLKEHGNL